MKVRLSDYYPKWRDSFENECLLISDIIPEEIVRFEHFGCTSVPGMKAKPVIDMMVLVKDINQIDSYNSKFLKERYDVAGEWGIPGRRLLRKGGDDRTHHIHIYQEGHPEIYRHLAVRDYLLEHPEEVKAYSDLKTKLAQSYDETLEYRNAKRDYVVALEKRALSYFRAK
ncbi:MAG: GrpB family protein [Macrococcus canis]|uniref:GrpB family protein n=1 Tax=Macrococcoides canis TaxID=1855823 RepID=UPI002E79590C|nr:GrpB family protein [Macrococcus canis]MEE1107713.1 GrpB family protein [Macrococcus canis]